MRADRYEALLDFLLEAVSDQGTTPFPAHVLAGMRQVAGCETVSYREWSPQELLEQSLAADEPEAIMGLWPGYRQVRHEDPLPGGARRGSPLPDREWLGRASDHLRFHQRSPVPPPGGCMPRCASRSACGP